MSDVFLILPIPAVDIGSRLEGIESMEFSELAMSIAPSPTLALNDKAKILERSGADVINLGIGEPGNHAPMGAILSGMASLQDGCVKYGATGGTPELKKAIIDYTAVHYRRTITPENILVSNGAKQSLFNVLFALLNPGDDVLLFAPYWVSYPEMVKIARGNVRVIVPGEDFQPDMDQVKAQVTTNTKVIILNNPNNPSGIVYNDDFVTELVSFCEAQRIFLIMDDIYHQLVFRSTPIPCGYDYSKRSVEEGYLIVTNGVSKTYGMTGFRIGWVVANSRLISLMGRIQSQMTSCAHMVSQAAAVGALTGSQHVTDNLRKTIQNNRDLVLRELSSIPGVRLTVPEGAFYILPDFRTYDADSNRLAAFLLEKVFVATVPGAAFGMEGFLRLSYAGPQHEVMEGIRRIRWALDPDGPDTTYLGDQKISRSW